MYIKLKIWREGIIEFYCYPENKSVSPFDAIDVDNYFAEVGEITYLGTFEYVGNISTPFDKRNDIFGGNFVLNIYKRHAIIENGKIVYINRKFDDGHITGVSRLKQIYYILYTMLLKYLVKRR